MLERQAVALLVLEKLQEFHYVAVRQPRQYARLLAREKGQRGQYDFCACCSLEAAGFRIKGFREYLLKFDDHEKKNMITVRGASMYSLTRQQEVIV